MLVCIDIVTVDERTDDVVCENEWSGFVMKVPSAKANMQHIHWGARTTLPVVPSRTPNKRLVHRMSPEQAALYCVTLNDVNALYIDPETLREAVFPAPILTGDMQRIWKMQIIRCEYHHLASVLAAWIMNIIINLYGLDKVSDTYDLAIAQKLRLFDSNTHILSERVRNARNFTA